MKSVLVDIGNSSRCKYSVTEDGQISSVVRTDRVGLMDAVSALYEAGGGIGCICFSSVAAPDADLEDFLRGRCARFIKVSSTIRLPISLDYASPSTLGGDRIAAAVGAASLFPGEDVLVVDFGSAITIDFISASGTFKGGNISPGLSMRFKALNHYTGALPLVDQDGAYEDFGRDTVSAIRGGVLLGIMFEVSSYIKARPGVKVVFTGGDALLFAKKLPSPVHVVPDLVLEGLAQIVRTNV